jgi:hypothetical protein
MLKKVGKEAALTSNMIFNKDGMMMRTEVNEGERNIKAFEWH